MRSGDLRRLQALGDVVDQRAVAEQTTRRGDGFATMVGAEVVEERHRELRNATAVDGAIAAGLKQFGVERRVGGNIDLDDPIDTSPVRRLATALHDIDEPIVDDPIGARVGREHGLHRVAHGRQNLPCAELVGKLNGEVAHCAGTTRGSLRRARPISDVGCTQEPVIASANFATAERLDVACAVTRRRFPVGASPTRQPLQPEAEQAWR